MMHAAALDLSALIGLPADEARARVEAAGEAMGAMVETEPPRPVALDGPFRVVRARRADDGRVELVVTRERFLPRADRE